MLAILVRDGFDDLPLPRSPPAVVYSFTAHAACRSFLVGMYAASVAKQLWGN